MANEVIILKSFKGIPFFTEKEEVRKILGPNYENSIEVRNKNKEVFNTPEIKELEETIGALYKEMGKGEFKWPDISQYEADYDSYPSFDIEYENNKFVSVSFWAEKQNTFSIFGHDCSDFEIEKLLSISDDFEWEPLHTCWTSNSKQISIFCPEGKRKAKNILFGCLGYFKRED